MEMKDFDILSCLMKIEEKQVVEYCNKCGRIKQLCRCKPITNADRIRSMTDEELAKFIADGEEWEEICDKCEQFDGCKDNTFCASKALEWLQTETE